MKVSQEEYSLLDELAKEVESEPMRPGEFTVEMFIERTGYSSNGARAFLDRKVRAGLLTMRRVKTDRCWVNVFGKKE